MADRIQLRRDTKANWESYNPILLEGEPGHVLDYPNLYKMGDGVHAWNDLPYRGYDGTVTQDIQDDENSVPSNAAVYNHLSKVEVTKTWHDHGTTNMNGKVYTGMLVTGSSYSINVIVLSSEETRVRLDVYNGNTWLRNIYDTSKTFNVNEKIVVPYTKQENENYIRVYGNAYGIDGSIEITQIIDLSIIYKNAADIKEIKSFGWEYGNIYPDGSIVDSFNRIHTKFIEIGNICNISCQASQKIAYALYNDDKEIVARWWDELVSTLDMLYISSRNPDARYFRVMMQNSDNSDFDLSASQPELLLSLVNNNENKPVQYSEKMAAYNKNLPVIIFNFDDCNPDGDYEVVKLFESKGVRCGFAFIATEQDIAEKSKLYLDFQRRGFDIMNHSSGVQSIIESNYTFEEARANIATGLERLQKAGFVVNGFVAPNSELSPSFLPIVKDLHAYHFIGTPYGSNDKNTDVCELVRYSLENNTKAIIKSYIDSCISEGKCLVFYSHTARFGQTIGGELFDLNKVSEILDYCIAKRDNLQCYLGGCEDALRYYYGAINNIDDEPTAGSSNLVKSGGVFTPLDELQKDIFTNVPFTDKVLACNTDYVEGMIDGNGNKVTTSGNYCVEHVDVSDCTSFDIYFGISHPNFYIVTFGH